jgi:hypothetical protein
MLSLVFFYLYLTQSNSLWLFRVFWALVCIFVGFCNEISVIFSLKKKRKLYIILVKNLIPLTFFINFKLYYILYIKFIIYKLYN